MTERAFDEQEYVAAIPDCCSLRTLEEHMEIMLCWGLAAAVREGKPMDCGTCELRRHPTVGGERG